MASPFSLSKSGKKGASREEYQKLLERETKRYGGNRDRAVRSANVAAGYGNSTAQRFKGGGGAAKPGGGGATKRPAGGGGGGKRKVDRQKTASVPENIPTPTPRPEPFSPDLAVSPQRPLDTMLGAPTNNPPPPMEIAPSPLMPPDPMAASAPTNSPPVRPQMPPPVMGVPPDLRGTPQSILAPPAPDSARWGAPVVGSGGPAGAGNPLVGGAPGPNPVVGSGNNARRNFFAQLLGLGG